MLQDLMRRQAGVITASQAHEHGISEDGIRARLRSGRWQRVFTGSRPAVYATFSGPVPRESFLWGAVLVGGPGAALSHHTAAEIDGLADDSTGVIHVTVPAHRQLRSLPVPRVVFHRSRRVEDCRHPAQLPPRTRIEETALDLTQAAEQIDDAMAWLARACQRRLTTPARLLNSLAARGKARWRREMREALGDVRDGAQTLLEIRYLRDVERAHKLPRADRQTRVIRSGRVNYDDMRYRDYGLVVELDGIVAHPASELRRDHDRDNVTIEQGGIPLRYGWGHVTERACATASQIASILSTRGWNGTPNPCHRPDCTLRGVVAA